MKVETQLYFSFRGELVIIEVITMKGGISDHRSNHHERNNNNDIHTTTEESTSPAAYQPLKYRKDETTHTCPFAGSA